MLLSLSSRPLPTATKSRTERRINGFLRRLSAYHASTRPDKSRTRKIFGPKTMAMGFHPWPHVRQTYMLLRQHGQVFLRECLVRLLVDVQVGHHQLFWRVRQPFRDRKIHKARGFEDLEETQVLVARVLDVVGQSFLHVTYIAGPEVHGACAPSTAKHRHPALPAKVVLPFVGVLMPMKLTHATGIDRHHEYFVVLSRCRDHEIADSRQHQNLRRKSCRSLVNAGRSLVIEDVNEFPRVPNEIDLQFSLLVDGEL